MFGGKKAGTAFLFTLKPSEKAQSKKELLKSDCETLMAELLQAHQRKQRGQWRVKTEHEEKESSINICSRNQEWAVSRR